MSASLAAFALILAALVGCGSSGGGMPPEQPAELWPAGLYAVSHPTRGSLHLSIDGSSVQVGGWSTRSWWDLDRGRWVLVGDAAIPGKGRLSFRLTETFRATFTYLPVTWTGTAHLVTAHG